MPDPAFLTRARLRTDTSLAALSRVLLPDDPSERVVTTHRLVWSLFADSADRRRDFLWREAAPGVFYLLSVRPPSDPHALFDLDPPKPFAPDLRPGDVLRFALRANPTVARGGGPGRRGKPCDIVMDALRRSTRDDRPRAREELAVAAVRDWLTRQGERSGFTLHSASGDGPGSLRMSYRVLRLPHRDGLMTLGIADVEGLLEVTDPSRCHEVLRSGLGRAKAFGCGLMLVRRP